MPVLKQYQSTPAMREAIVLDLGDIGAQAARIRAAAETQAQQIIANAEAKTAQNAQQRGEEAEQLGYIEGLERGLAEGREQGRAEALAASAEQLRQLMAAWSQVATDWEQQRTEMEREARQAVLDFALSTAEKVVHRVIEVDESVIVDQAAQALSMVLSAHDASIRIHPVDRPMLEDALPELLQELVSFEHIELIDDEEVTPGGCVVAFGQGRVDATIEKQMQRIVDLILPEPPQAIYNDQDDQDTMQEASAEPAIPEILPSSDPIPPAPVYEITEQGLVDAGQTQAPSASAQLEDQAAYEPEPEPDASTPDQAPENEV